MHDHPRTARGGAIRLAACTVLAVAIVAAGAAAFGRRAEVRLLVREGKPREVAECMVQLRQSWGECEVGMFTGTYPAAWDSVPQLVPVRDAVRRVRAAGGRWTFADEVHGRSWRVCAALPGRTPRCSTDVRTASAVAFGEPAPRKRTPAVLAVSPARRRLCTPAALASLRRRTREAGDGRARAALAERMRACGATAA